MKVVIQRVSHASVTINGTVKSSIGKGFLILLGIGCEDTQEDIDWLVIDEYNKDKKHVRRKCI